MAINIPIFSSLDTKGFDRAKKEFKSLEGFGAKAGYIVKNAMLPMGVAVGAVATFGYKAAKAAGDLNEELNKSRVIFGTAADQIEQFGNTAARTLGQSKKDAIAAASSFGIMGQAAGLTGTDLAKFSTRLVTLTADLASFNNARPEDVVQALGAALRGEAEPMRKFGVLLNDAALKAEAMAMGIYKGKGPLNDQAKILAANRLILKQTAVAQGDFANTSDSLANQQRIANASLEDLLTTIGQEFLPIVETATRFVATLATEFGDKGAAGAIAAFRSMMQDLTRSNDGTINSFGTLINALITVRNAVAHVLNAFIRLYNVLPILDDIPTINMLDQLGTNLGDFYKSFSGATAAAEAQRKLNNYMGPVASRNVETLGKFQDEYRKALVNTAQSETELDKATGGSSKKLQQKKKDLTDATKAAKEYAAAIADAVETVRDGFSPALQSANERLTDAQGIYNDYYKSIRNGITGVMDIGAAWSEAANSEGAKTFFGVLKDQAAKAQTLAGNLEYLISKGLDDPTLLQAIVNQGADTGLAITDAIIAGGTQGLEDIKRWTDATASAAEKIAKVSADKWFQSGVDQAQAVVDGINSLIADTEFALKFVVDVEGAQQLGTMFGTNVETVLGGGTAAPMFNPGDFSAAAFMALGQPAGGTSLQNALVNINVNGGDPQAIVDALRRYNLTNGPIPVQVG